MLMKGEISMFFLTFEWKSRLNLYDNPQNPNIHFSFNTKIRKFVVSFALFCFL